MSSKRKSVRLSAEAAADSIHVVCRFRPAKNNEVAASNTINIDSTGKEVEIIDNFDKRTFAFDQVFSFILDEANRIIRFNYYDHILFRYLGCPQLKNKFSFMLRV